MLLNFIKKKWILLLHILALLIIIAVFVIVRSVKIANDRRGPEKAFNIAGNIVRVEYQLPGEEEITAVTERQEDIKLLLDCIELARQIKRTAIIHYQAVAVGPHITYTYADGSQRTYDYDLSISDNYTYPFKAFEEISYIATQLSIPEE